MRQITKTYLEITMKIETGNRSKAGAVYAKFKQPFLSQIKGAVSKELLLRSEDVQVLHGFEEQESAKEYLNSDMFKNDVVNALAPLLTEAPEIRIYQIA